MSKVSLNKKLDLGKFQSNYDDDRLLYENIMDSTSILDPRFLAFYQPLHEKYSNWAFKLTSTNSLESHNSIQDLYIKHTINDDDMLKSLPKEHKDLLNALLYSNSHQRSNMVINDFKIDLPEWCSDQRNQMTGPIDDEELIVKMLNSNAPGVMLDAEDSMANKWSNTQKMITNIFRLFRGGKHDNIKPLSYTKNGKTVEINKNSNTVVWFRPRGLRLRQILKFPLTISSVTTSAALFDVAMYAFNFDSSSLPIKDQPMCIYIPKTEYPDEALWWDSLFKDIANIKGWDSDYIKCMALVESMPIALANHLDRFIYLLKDHILGLNLGRWDYIASMIENVSLYNHNWIFPDRNTLPHDAKFFQSLRMKLVNTCHKHGILAIGGMTALYPNRSNPELNKKALDILKSDKSNEASMGMDGAWTGHPDQNDIAISQFPVPNQLDFQHELPSSNELNLLCLPEGDFTLEGTKQCARTMIGYINGVLNGKGAVFLDGYMEDLATYRICKSMLKQRRKNDPDHHDKMLLKIFNDEFDKLQSENQTIKLEAKNIAINSII